MDADPWLFNVENGTLDLRTGQLRTPRREDYITKVAGCPYFENARAPKWEAFLTQIFGGNISMSGYFQRCAGYSMTGSVREQKLFMPHGEGANGKSTALGVIRKLMGDYGCPAPKDLLMTHRSDAHPTSIADLEGVRFVLGVETDEGRRMAEAFVKQMTGGDALKGRRMYEDFHSFDPQCKLWLAVNHPPIVRGTDHAIWRRIQRIPFVRTIQESEQDKDLSHRLGEELPGILKWCLTGCLEWQERGLDTPTNVTEATAEYRADMDLIASFINSMCETGDLASSVTKRDLYRSYSDWCVESGEEALTQRMFSYRLTERGIQSDRTKSAHLWKGIRLIG